MKDKNVSVIIAAAGMGSRMGKKTNKQFLTVGEVPVLVRTLKIFSEWSHTQEIIISAKKEEILRIESLINKYSINNAKVVCGGNTRQKSVFNALEEAAGEYVFIHDGARPFVTKKCLDSLWAATKENGAAALGITPKDTVAFADNNGFLTSVPKREGLKNMQTPQCFKTCEILAAHRAADKQNALFTDDCSLFLAHGGRIFVADGLENNIKITVPKDLDLAEKIAASFEN